MRKFLAGLLALLIFTVAVPLTAEAHNGCSRHRKVKRTYNSRNYRRVQPRYYRTYRTVQPRYRTAGYTYRRPSFYRRHRNLINLGIATGGGAIIGALAGGKKGAGVGALIGAGGGALYTYVLKKKKRRY